VSTAGNGFSQRRKHELESDRGQLAADQGQVENRVEQLIGNDPIGGTQDQLARLPEQKYGDLKEQAEEACGEFPHGLIPVPISNSSRRDL